MSKKVLAVLSGLVLAGSVSAADLKVGVVDLRKLIDQSAQSQKSQADLKKEFQPKETKLVNEQKELKKLEDGLDSAKSRLKELKLDLKSASINGDRAERRKLEPKVKQAEEDVQNLTMQIEKAQKELDSLEKAGKESGR